MIVKIEENICTACGRCAEICPVEAISKKDDKYVIDNNSCINCLACERECPVNAILWDYNDEEITEDCNNDNAGKNSECDFVGDNSSVIKENLNNSTCIKKKIDRFIKEIPANKKKKIIRTLRFIVEDTIAPVVEKAFLLFIDGSERIFKKRK